MKRYSLLFVLFFICSFLKAQTYLKPGYVVVDKDTIHGFIDYQNWEYNPEFVSFKKLKFTEFSVYGVEDISAFEVNGRMFERQTIEQRNVQSAVFLEVIVKGDKSLYYLHTAKGVEQFYILQNGSMSLLGRGLKTDVMQVNQGCRKQLKQYLDGCNTIHDKINSTTYELSSLANLFDDYYRCSEQDEYLFKKYIKEGKTEFGVIAGASLTYMNVRSSYSEFVDKTVYNPSLDFTGGLYVNYIFRKSSGQWSSYNEILYGAYLVKGVYEEREHDQRYKIVKSELGNQLLKLNNMIKYTRPLNKLSLTISGGISNGFALSETNHAERKEVFYTQERMSTFEAIDHTKSHFLSFLFGVGVQVNRLAVEARIEAGNGISRYLNSSKTRYNLLLSYKI